MAHPTEPEGPPQLSVLPPPAESEWKTNSNAASAPGGVRELYFDEPLHDDGWEAYRRLIRAGVVTVAQVEARLAEGTLTDVPGIGPAREAKIERALDVYEARRRDRQLHMLEYHGPPDSLSREAAMDILRTYRRWLKRLPSQHNPMHDALARSAADLSEALGGAAATENVVEPPFPSAANRTPTRSKREVVALGLLSQAVRIAAAGLEDSPLHPDMQRLAGELQRDATAHSPERPRPRPVPSG